MTGRPRIWIIRLRSADVGATEENVHDGDTEVWEIYNTTGDVHPMHFHLVNVQVINRQLFDVTTYSGFIRLHRPRHPARPERDGVEGDGADVPRHGDPGHHEVRPADRDRMETCQLALAAVAIRTDASASPRTGGNEYVWHCHILEHEEHDMMHALVVT